MRPVDSGPVRGPLAGAAVADLREWLTVQRYSSRTIPQVLNVALWLSAWMDDHGVTLDAVDDAVLDEFMAGFIPGTPGRATVMGRLPAVRRYLLDPHSRSSRMRGPDGVGPERRELDAWAVWQREQGGISEAVIRNRRRWVRGFIATRVDDNTVGWGEVDVASVNAYIAERGKGYAPPSCSLLVSAMRRLLRWALVTGRIDRDLNQGILRTRATRATLPRGLTPAQLDALLAATDPATRVGVRDRAALITLARLGLRAGEAAGLMLEDIDWAAGRLSVVGKGQRRLMLPLPADVGDAIVAWLRVRHTHAQDRAVFVRLRAPIGKLTSAGISDIVAHAAERAGLDRIGAHRLRRSYASSSSCGAVFK